MLYRTVFLCLTALLACAGCSRQPGPFSDQNARAHIGMLAGTIGSRPVGTSANAKAREYIVDQLRMFGYEVRVQEADARRGSLGRAARVANIIAIRPGRRAEAIGLVSHYDSASGVPGAGDDALGVGVSLEAARVLGARTDRQWSLMILLTDGEEAGLMGAAALMTDREVTSRLQAYINVEAIGSAGPPMLFETGPGNGWLVSEWARFAPHPRGGSFGIEIYRRLPNDTDFSILKLQDIPGLNLAAVRDSYAYHTPRDTPERLSTETVRQTGEQVVAVMTALDRADITQRSRTGRTYFDVAGVVAVSYRPTFGWVLSAVAVVVGIIAWVRVTAAAIRIEGVLRWLLAYIWTLVGAVAVVAAMIGATWALRAAREVYHPWYARPGRLFLLLVAVGAAAGWMSVRLGYWVPKAVHGVRHPMIVWTVTLPVWIAIASGALWLAPEAAYLWIVPLATAGFLFAIVPAMHGLAVRTASAIVLAVAGALWIRDTAELLYFTVTILGRLPIVTPVVVYPALVAAAALMVVPPLAATVVAPRPLLRPSIGTSVCLLAIAVTAGLAYAAPAYTYEEPLRRQARVVQESEQAATWQVASVEPGLDLADGAPSGWTAVPAGASLSAGSIPIRRLPHPFVFRTDGPPLGPPPIAIAALSLEPVAAGTELAVTVVPREAGLHVSFVLPEGVKPARSSLPGMIRLGRWTATYIAPPPEGLAFRASFAASDSARLREVRILATAEGGNPAWRLPAWLPQERTVWSADATWIVAPFSLPIAPVPPLR